MDNRHIILVLSAAPKNGNLTEEGKKRVKFAADSLNLGLADILLMSGRQYFRELLDFKKTHAEMMEDYAHQLGIALTHIKKEEYSIETVAQPLFSDILYLDHLRPSKIQVVSSDYHQRRVESICALIFGDKYNLGFSGIETGLKDDAATLKKERSNLEAFRNTFKGVRDGDIEATIATLFKRHPVYSGLVEAMREFEKGSDMDYTKIIGVMKNYSMLSRPTGLDLYKVYPVLRDYIRLKEKIKSKFDINLYK